MAMLTRRQLDRLNFIKAYIADNEIAPSVDEIRIGMWFRSKSSVAALLGSLEERGAIRRLRTRARAIEVTE